MEHETFGKIVAALRKEHVNFANGHNWSQQDLADELGLTQRIVSKIERGRQSRLDGEILRELATAFDLTSLERREFFAMANEITDSEMVRTDLCNEEVFAQVWTLLDDLCAPAFLIDPFADVVGVNRALLALHNISIAELQSIKTTATGVNNLALLLAPDTPLRQVLGHGWRPIALANVQQWRAMTLRYRHTHRFRQLFAALSAYPDFRMLWVAGIDHERAIDDCSRLRSCIYTHGVHGPVAYTVFTNTSLSAYGELHLSTFVPQDRVTAALFQGLADKNNHALSFAPWPNPSLTLSSAGRPQ